MSITFQGFLQGQHERWRTERAKGLHDDQCEARERSLGCDCSRRRRIAAGKTELPYQGNERSWDFMQLRSVR